jgi:hypothetical protein
MIEAFITLKGSIKLIQPMTTLDGLSRALAHLGSFYLG